MYSEDQVPQQLKSTPNPMPDRSKLYRAAPLTHYYKTGLPWHWQAGVKEYRGMPAFLALCSLCCWADIFFNT